MEFREIATFLQAAQLKSFSKAARKLDYSQGAVTIQIKHLESELGVRLFDRIGKQVSLTHQGELFYRYAVSLTPQPGGDPGGHGRHPGAHRHPGPGHHRVHLLLHHTAHSLRVSPPFSPR